MLGKLFVNNFGSGKSCFNVKEFNNNINVSWSKNYNGLKGTNWLNYNNLLNYKQYNGHFFKIPIMTYTSVTTTQDLSLSDLKDLKTGPPLNDEYIKKLLDYLDSAVGKSDKSAHFLMSMITNVFTDSRTQRQFIKRVVFDVDSIRYFKKLDSEIPKDVQANIDTHAKAKHTKVNTIEELFFYMVDDEDAFMGTSNVVNPHLMKYIAKFVPARRLWDEIIPELEQMAETAFGPYTPNPKQSIAKMKDQLLELFEGKVDVEEYQILNDRDLVARCVYENTMERYGVPSTTFKEIAKYAELSLGASSIDMTGPAPQPFHTHVEPPLIKPFYEIEEDEHDD